MNVTQTTIESATLGFQAWKNVSVEERAELLSQVAKKLQEHHAEFYYLAIFEAGKTIVDAIAELREAIDFCYYYAAEARRQFAHPIQLPGPTGEDNLLLQHGRGVIACISPWNFPLAIFIGQITAALAAGNSVIAKPAEQTPLIAALAIKIMHEVGIPKNVVALLPGKGSVVGAKLVEDERIAGVVFTGSTEVARTINQALAARKGPIVPLIAETGGQNAMIVDSSALPEQVVIDVIQSAFGSAGQRCSALRILFVQEDVADHLLEMLKGAMAEICVGNPLRLSSDVGPVIDEEARAILEKHAQRMEKEAQLLYQVELSKDLSQGSYFAPRAYEISDITQLTEEVFGPILHIIRYDLKDLDKVIESINNTQYGLTLGIQSRVDETVAYIQERMNVGNVYVNRTVIGAVVGVQPFGGQGLSGTGPKAGGPFYLHRFCHEQTVSINTAAAGGNATLMSLGD